MTRTKQNIAYRQLTIASNIQQTNNCDWDALPLLILSSPNSNNHNTYYKSGMGEPGTYNLTSRGRCILWLLPFAMWP